MDIWHDFPGPNAAYVLDLYDQFLRDPGSVDLAARAFFEGWSGRGSGLNLAVASSNGSLAATAERAEPAATPGGGPPASWPVIVGVARLAQAIRAYGHRAARLDPLGSPPPGDPALDLAAYGLADEDLTGLPAGLVGGPCVDDACDARQALAALRGIYCSTIGYDYDYVHDPEERAWLREAVEERRFGPPRDPIDAQALLGRLTEVEVFEQFLHRVFPGRTRFSIEGLDVLVPMLDELIAAAADNSICTIFIGMGHRGRLNVLAHVLNKPYAQILAEFKDPVAGHYSAVRADLGWTGDVKYHKGGSRAVAGGEPVQMMVQMPPNPSHLEFIDPVVAGMARAAATEMDRRGAPRYDPQASLPILVHGDAAFPGQGIVAETLNLSGIPGYGSGGTLHIIANNQLGFTAAPQQSRSTSYASDLAKGFNIPVAHVNADDPLACVQVARLAFAYRARFHKDFLIDLIGYRRHGHNEGDEPSFTQPLMYKAIDAHPSVRRLLADRLVEQGLPAEEPDQLVAHGMKRLQDVLDGLKAENEVGEPQIKPPPRGAAGRVHTALPLERLRALNDALLALPGGFTPNPKLARALARRGQALADPDAATIDWATAEELALASILEDGTPVRFTGQDVERGAFNHRHAVFHDFETDATFVPLQALPGARAGFMVANSPLSENATLGFEYGYNIQAPRRLVIWEAQYGDFLNGAQGVVDEFVVSARAKWEQTPSLILLLPHGYEGQGPDHSGGRLERLLQSAAEINLRIAYPTTAAQYFHLLRRQAALLEGDPLPLAVMSPKSLLRHPLAASSPRELAEGAWQAVIDDPIAAAHPDRIRRLILCTGKVFVDLAGSKRRQERPEIAIARLEQVYPFPDSAARALLAGYPNLEMVIWVQEEPENMGAWTYVRPLLSELLDGHGRAASSGPLPAPTGPHRSRRAGPSGGDTSLLTDGRRQEGDAAQASTASTVPAPATLAQQGRLALHFVGRPSSSSPAEGSAALHAINQSALVEQAYNLESDVVQQGIVWLKKA
jgi:2-oxoglutarate dehydrogenase E1 component